MVTENASGPMNVCVRRTGRVLVVRHPCAQTTTNVMEGDAV